jgi:hypothetical protein
MTHPDACDNCLHDTWLTGSSGCECLCHQKTAFEDPSLPSVSPEWIEFRKSICAIISKPDKVRLTEEEKKTLRKECYERNKDKKIAYRKEHYERNKDKVLTKNKAYHEANKDKIRAHYKEYLKVNKDKIFARRKEYYEKNRDRIIAYNKRYRDSKLKLTKGKMTNWTGNE